MIEVRQTEIFARWLANLRDGRARARINARIRRLSVGNPGDAKRSERRPNPALGRGCLPLRNTRYQAGATLYLGRTLTGWISPAFLAH